MSKKKALERARKNWGSTGNAQIFPKSRRHFVGLKIGFCLMGYGLGKTWDEAFKMAEAHFPPRKGEGR
jgi:hypothetical protein